MLERESDWWLGCDLDNPTVRGYFPNNYVQLLPAVRVITSDKSKKIQIPPIQKAKVLYSLDGAEDKDLSILVGDVLVILKQDGDWWYGHPLGNDR